MSPDAIAFYVLAAVAVGSAVSVVAQRHPISSALSLVVSLCAVAGIYALLEAHFLAAVQVIVYAGAIMVLFVFVIMLLDLSEVAEDWDRRRAGLRAALTAGGSLLFVGVIIHSLSERRIMVPGDGYDPARIHELGGNSRMVAETLFARYTVPFEAASVLLLVAMVGTVVMAKRSLAEREGRDGGAA